MLKPYMEAALVDHSRRRGMRSLGGVHEAGQSQSHSSIARIVSPRDEGSPMIVVKHMMPVVSEGTGPLYNSTKNTVDDYMKSSNYVKKMQRLRETSESLPTVGHHAPYSKIKAQAGDELLLSLIKARPRVLERLEIGNMTL